MFRKEFLIKSNLQLKTSEKKKLQNGILSSFPVLSKDDINELFPQKENPGVIKALTHCGKNVLIYQHQSIPYFFEFDNRLYPTIFMLWKLPHAVPSITTHEPVIQKLNNGADLMVPGIIKNEEVHFGRNSPIAINVADNMAALAVGHSLINNECLQTLTNGKAVVIHHVFGDKLYTLASPLPAKPILHNIDRITKEVSDSQNEELIENLTSVSIEPDEQLPVQDEITMDQLLNDCFCKAAKQFPKDSLPVLTNVFYKKNMLDALPSNTTLDIKKTKCKKLSVFLKEKAAEGIIQLEDVKGVQSILNINSRHISLKNITPDEESTEPDVPLTVSDRHPVKITEGYVVSGLPSKFLANYGRLNKGDVVTKDTIQKCFEEYIKRHELNTSRGVRIDQILKESLNVKDEVYPWRSLMIDIYNKLGRSYSIELSDGAVISRKEKLPPIMIKVGKRSNNKKVTMVDNLEIYGLNIKEFAKVCQHTVSASTTINEGPSMKTKQFQIQGDQSIHIKRILNDKYKIPSYYIYEVDDKKGKNK